MRLHFLLGFSKEAITGGSIYNRIMVDGLQGYEGVSVTTTYLHPDQIVGGEIDLDEVIYGIIDQEPSHVVLDGIFAHHLSPKSVKILTTSPANLVMIAHLPSFLIRPEEDNTGELEAYVGSHLVVATSDYVAGELRALLPETEVVSVPPGLARELPSNQFATRSPGGLIELIYAANISKVKRQDLLIRSLAKLESRNWRMTLQGSIHDTDYHEECVNLVSELSLEDRVRFSPPDTTKELQSILTDYDVYVSTSSYETFGMSVLDALAAGKPVVATPAGSLEATYGQSIWIVQDDPAEIAAAVDALITSEKRRREYGEKGLAFGGSFPSWSQRVVQFYFALKRISGGNRFHRWLEARLPYDRSAMDNEAAHSAQDRISSVEGSTPVILDVGSGSGSSVVHLAEMVSSSFTLHLLDRDSDLISKFHTFVSKFIPHEIRTLADRFYRLISNEQRITVRLSTGDILNLKEFLPDPVHLLTANAVFDLFSRGQFIDFIDQLPEDLPLLLTLNYCGSQLQLDDRELQDESHEYFHLYDEHMQRERSFGRSMGPNCCSEMSKILGERYSYVVSGTSNWVINRQDRAVVSHLIWFMEQSVPELLTPRELPLFQDWLRRFRSHIHSKEFTWVVQHKDFYASNQS